MNRDWMTDANCTGADTETFYTNDPAEIAAATTLCRRCPVTAECLAYSLEHETTGTRYGIWGGLTPPQRARRAILTDNTSQ